MIPNAVGYSIPVEWSNCVCKRSEASGICKQSEACGIWSDEGSAWTSSVWDCSEGFAKLSSQFDFVASFLSSASLFALSIETFAKWFVLSWGVSGLLKTLSTVSLDKSWDCPGCFWRTWPKFLSSHLKIFDMMLEKLTAVEDDWSFCRIELFQLLFDFRSGDIVWDIDSARSASREKGAWVWKLFTVLLGLVRTWSVPTMSLGLLLSKSWWFLAKLSWLVPKCWRLFSTTLSSVDVAPKLVLATSGPWYGDILTISLK